MIEVSSYQLDLTTSFAPDVAILTNISPDHLDRHGGMDGYVAAKARIFQAQGPDAVALVSLDDARSAAIGASLTAAGRHVRTVSTAVAAGIRVDGGVLSIDGEPVASLAGARSLPGRHNAQNAAFAWGAARALGVPREVAAGGLMTFPGLAHRMEHVGTLGDVRFINDSKATNTDAARQALLSYPSVFWIAGGRAKAGGIDDLADLFPRIARAYLIGEAAPDFARTLSGVSHQISGDMASAVAQAAADAAEVAETHGPQVVLLSPAAASFDQYPDFEARGEAFRAAVLALGATPAASA